MIFLQVFLAILAAMVVVRVGFRLALRRHFGRGHHRGMMMHGHHHHGGRRLFRLYRKLDLSREQKASLRELFRELRGEAGELRGELRDELPRALAGLMAGAEFDRVSAARLADDRLASLARMKDKVLDVLARAHAVLTPAQREVLVGAFAA